ncbi:glycosyltransferase [Peribacillus asahii]|uniref:glycosyltransferase n=1 Tax=Peribacillus asahii TaxID=228899 RepID=UPI00381612E1
MFWLPHFVNISIFKDYQYPKEIKWLLMGMTSNHYPLRQIIKKHMINKKGFVYHRHPGYKNVNDQDSKIFVGRNYAKEINRAKMFFTDDSKFHYPFMKYYEVLACNTLLLAPANQELLDLGFKPGENFVEITSPLSYKPNGFMAACIVDLK